MDVLEKDLQVVIDHFWRFPFIFERIELTLFLWISVYFFWCHSLLKWFFQNGYNVESTYCLPWQFKHLKECRQDLPFFVSRHGGFVFSLALQHQPNSQWFSNLCGLLYLMHFEPWILHENIEWPHFQQFLHCGIPELVLVPLIAAIYFPTLKHWLMRSLAFALL